MTSLEILLILIGAGILIFSCFLVDRSTTPKEAASYLIDAEGEKRHLSVQQLTELLTLEETELVKNKIDSIISEATEEAVVKVDDILSQISNEKIIAVNDFSNQLLEKINQNHEEVVFLYKMLHEKENELKDTMKQIDQISNKLSDVKVKSKTKENSKTSKKNQADKDLNEMNQLNGMNDKTPDETSENKTERILDLYSQGKTIIEISKLLNLGQGEVKLVIDLYKSK